MNRPATTRDDIIAALDEDCARLDAIADQQATHLRDAGVSDNTIDEFTRSVGNAREYRELRSMVTVGVIDLDAYHGYPFND